MFDYPAWVRDLEVEISDERVAEWVTLAAVHAYLNDRGYVPSPAQPGRVPVWEPPADLLLDSGGPAKRLERAYPARPAPLRVSLHEEGSRHVLRIRSLIHDIARIECRGALGVLLDLMGPVDYPSWFCELDLSIKDQGLDKWITPAGIRAYLKDHGWALAVPMLPEVGFAELWDPAEIVGTWDPQVPARTLVYLRGDGEYPRQVMLLIGRIAQIEGRREFGVLLDLREASAPKGATDLG